MKLSVTTDEGIVVGFIEGLEEYDFEKSFAGSSLVADIAEMVKRGQAMETADEAESKGKRRAYCAGCGEYLEMEQGNLCAECYADRTDPMTVCPGCLADVARSDLAQSGVEGVFTCTACRLREAAAS